MSPTFDQLQLDFERIEPTLAPERLCEACGQPFIPSRSQKFCRRNACRRERGRRQMEARKHLTVQTGQRTKRVDPFVGHFDKSKWDQRSKASIDRISQRFARPA